MDNGPVPPPDQLGSKARLMTVVNLASEEWSCPHWTASLCDWVGCVCVCVCLCVFVNVNWDLNDDKQMPAIGASTHNLALLPPEITTQNTSVPPCRPTPGYTVGVLERERGKWISMIPSLFNKLIKHFVLHPEVILKWLSHSSVMLLIDRGWKGAQKRGTMKEGAKEKFGGHRMAKGQIRQSWNSCV